MKIELELISLRNQHIHKTYDAYCELLEDRVHYKVKFKGEEPVSNDDQSLGWEKVSSYWERTAKKERVSGADFEFIQKTSVNKNEESYWKVSVVMTGFTQDVPVYFAEEEKAREFYNQVVEWLFK